MPEPSKSSLSKFRPTFQHRNVNTVLSLRDNSTFVKELGQSVFCKHTVSPKELRFQWILIIKEVLVDFKDSVFGLFFKLHIYPFNKVGCRNIFFCIWDSSTLKNECKTDWSQSELFQSGKDVCICLKLSFWFSVMLSQCVHCCIFKYWTKNLDWDTKRRLRQLTKISRLLGQKFKTVKS